MTCGDVLEHVPDYVAFLREMVRVSSRVVFLSTPNRRPEYTRPDGQPRNRWHLREWTYEELDAEELDAILQAIRGVHVEWSLLDGPWEGPFDCTSTVSEGTMALAPALVVGPIRRRGNKLQVE